MYTKILIWIGSVLFISFDEAWQFMFAIPNNQE